MRAKIYGTAEKPRLTVFRSNRYLHAQLINDEKGMTVISASSREVAKKATKTPVGDYVGTAIAERAKKAGITKAVFDRGSYQYHGKVKALVEAARKGGLVI